MNQIHLAEEIASTHSNSLFAKLNKIKHAVGSTSICSTSLPSSYPVACLERQISMITAEVESYKLRKAEQIAKICCAHRFSLSSVMANMRACIQKQVEMMLEGENSLLESKNPSSPKEPTSTVANSQNKGGSNDTPSFDLMGKEEKVEHFSIDLREFTLGQNEKSISGGSQQEREERSSGQISDFSTAYKQSSSKRIKDKIMNSGKTKSKRA